jgi:hypothetical protein
LIKVNLSEKNTKELIETSAEDWVKKKRRITVFYSFKDINKKIYYKNYEAKVRVKINDEESLNFQGLELANEIENNIYIQNKQKYNEIRKPLPTETEEETFMKTKTRRKRIKNQNNNKNVEHNTINKGFRKKLIITNICLNNRKIY